ncbi:MAG: MFS transporter, partial [Hyphomicrobiales bacterium]|nr:MFS transporter [Hyphomicrobiales bacterium]
VVADTRGAKLAVIAGLILATLSGLAYLISLNFVATPRLSVAILLVGRLLLGGAESLIVTGALSWGVVLVGPENAGRVIAWIGMAMYGAYAVGAPAGVAIDTRDGFHGIAVATVVIPLAALALVAILRPVPPSATRRAPFYPVLGAVWLPGLGLAGCSVGFGTITAFMALLFTSRGWGGASLVFTAFGAAFILARLLFGHLPDTLGGAKVALVCVLIEAAGMLLIWGAGNVHIAELGAALTGFGYSLAFPGFGVEAVRRAPAESRGAAMGAYVAFLDLSLGLAAPLNGAIADHAGIDAVYLAGAAAVGVTVLVALRLLRAAPSATPSPARGPFDERSGGLG